MSENVFIRGRSNEIAQVEPRSKNLVVMDDIHARIHEGIFYETSVVVTGVADAGTLELLLRVPAGTTAAPHVRIIPGAGGDARFQLFEGPTVSSSGTGLTPVNRNRLSSNTAALTVFQGPTTSDDGTELADELLPGGTGFVTPGGSLPGFEEWILDFDPDAMGSDKDYLVRLTNNAGNAQPLGLVLNHYEDG